MTHNTKWTPKDLGEAFFPVALRRVYMLPFDNSNDYVELKRHFAVTDMEEKKEFAIVTDEYELVTNQEAYERAETALMQVFKITKLDDLLCLNITMPKTRSFCHIDLIRKDSDFSPWEDEKWTAFLRITNSYNRTRLLRYELGFCRWICLNGMIFGARSIEFTYTHTKRGMDKVHRFSDNIGEIALLEAQLKAQLQQLQRYHVPEEKMIPLFCKAFDIKIDESKEMSQQYITRMYKMKSKVDSLINSYFSEMGQHGYAALNVFTEFATNPVGVIFPEGRIHDFQQKASTWMLDFINAISDTKFSFDSYIGQEYLKSAEIIQNMFRSSNN